MGYNYDNVKFRPLKITFAFLKGDSGGPLLVEVDSSYFMQIGIVSFGFRCAVPHSAGVYTRVSTYIEWIKSITKEAVTCAEPV